MWDTPIALALMMTLLSSLMTFTLSRSMSHLIHCCVMCYYLPANYCIILPRTIISIVVGGNYVTISCHSLIILFTVTFLLNLIAPMMIDD